MAFDRFMISPQGINTGLQNDVRPWLIPDDAFTQLNNAYVFRSRVRKRFGSVLMQTDTVSDTSPDNDSRLRIVVGTTDAGGNFAGIVPGTVFEIGQRFSIGDEIYTVYQTGAPAATLSTGSGIFLYNTTNGAFSVAGGPLLADIYFYPAEPVMGLITYSIGDINDEPLYAFDTQFAYEYTNLAWQRLGTAVWTGTDIDFFWGATWKGNTNNENILFVTNFVPADSFKYWDGATWTNFTPVFNSTGGTIVTARLIVPFKDRLLLFNTIENTGSDIQFFNRVRFCQNGSPLSVDAWREDIPGRGDYLDCPVKQQIITAEFLKDRLTVYFESSTWELVYTGNEVLPFRWQQINTELGAESTFSVIPFDKVMLGIGNQGIHACNGANTERIDKKIPDEVFKIHDESDGIRRVQGIRDYSVEMVYWTFPEPGITYPNRVLVYNYRNDSWAFNNDTFTAFGHFQQQASVTWGTETRTWAEIIETWDSGSLQGNFRQVVAGNQEGFVFIIDPDSTTNASGLQITDIAIAGSLVTLTIINHNLKNDEYVLIDFAQGSGLISSLNGSIFKVTVVTVDTITIFAPTLAGTYTGAGTVARVTPPDIKTKQFNFYAQDGKNAYIPQIDFLVDKTDNGQMTVDFFNSASDYPMVENTPTIILGTSVLETSPYSTVPFESQQSRLWHRVYFQAEGECVQFRIYQTEEQATNPLIAESDFELHAMVIYAQRTSRLQ